MTGLRTPRCLSVAASDSGGGAGIQADIKAFAAAGCHGTTAVVGLTAQNTQALAASYAVPPWIITAQLDAVFNDLHPDAIKTGALLSADSVNTVADSLARQHAAGSLPPLVVDPVIIASSGALLLQDDAVEVLTARILPLATVVTPNRSEASRLAGIRAGVEELAERLVAMGVGAAVITGSGDEPDHLFDGHNHVSIAVPRVQPRATHGSGCTHSATLCARLAHGDDLERAARAAAAVTAEAIAHGLEGVGAGDGPVDVIGVQEQGRPSRAL
jgi:hydroxymethylpyrimidine/phosphomethylpyrimidine kinase